MTDSNSTDQVASAALVSLDSTTVNDSSIIEDIRTIAGTQKILERLNKIDGQGGNVADKNGIGSFSSINPIINNTFSGGNFGLPPGDSPLIGTGSVANGASGSVSTSPPTVTANTTPGNTTGSYSNFGSFTLPAQNPYTSGRPGGSGGGSPDGSKGDDKSGSAGGGSAPNTQGGTGGGQSNNSDLQKKADILRAAGFNEETIAKILNDDARFEPGVENVGELMAGNTYPIISYSTPLGNSGVSLDTGGTVLKGVTGVDPTDSNKTVYVRFDGLLPVVSSSDSGARGQGLWVTNTTPPDSLTWRLGYVWNSAYEPSADYADWSDLDTAVLAALIPLYPGTNHTITDYDTSGLPANVTPHMQYTDNTGVTHSNINAAFYTSTPCTAGSSSNCPVTAPKVKQLPDFNNYTLSLYKGVFTYNQYDSNVPTQFLEGLSQVAINSPAGDQFTIIPAIYGGFAIYASDQGQNGRGLYFDSLGQLRDIFTTRDLAFYKVK